VRHPGGTPLTHVVFLGPTLSAADARGVLDAVYLPPAAQGDVYHAAQSQPHAIGIIDGYFERVPSVWHKEILWAMSRGIHVYGAASMGALRAAELHHFGMVGVGQVFEAFRDGSLQEDDEVAVAHGTAETGYRPLTEAMVNIRATLAAAEREGVLGALARVLLERLARELFYAERSYGLLLRKAAGEGAPSDELRHFERWLPGGRRDAKREDALALLEQMCSRREADSVPLRVDFTFEYTERWHAAIQNPQPAGRAVPGLPLTLERVLDELRLLGATYVETFEKALARHCVSTGVTFHTLALDPAQVDSMTQQFRRLHEIESEESLERWLDVNHLSRAGFNRLMREETRLATARYLVEDGMRPLLVDHLRATGQYAPLASRAQEKLATLESRGFENPGLADTGLARSALLAWYFERLGRSVPENLQRYARAAGFFGYDALQDAVVREYCYLRAREATGGP
jgi:hypothetical protein